MVTNTKIISNINMNDSITSWSSNNSFIYPAYFNSIVARADSKDRQLQNEARERKY